jgi:hypothetical protein
MGRKNEAKGGTWLSNDSERHEWVCEELDEVQAGWFLSVNISRNTREI